MSEFVSLSDTVRIGATLHHPSGGYLVNGDVAPRYFVYKNDSDTEILAGAMTLRSGFVGTYRANFVASVGNGFAKNDYVEVQVSGMVDGIVGRCVLKTFVIDDVYDANVVKISGVPAVSPVDIYFAGTKFVKDGSNNQDEYVVQWFKNSLPLGSGGVTNAAMSVFNTSNGVKLISDKILHLTTYNGSLRASETVNLATSGEPYLLVTSGTIDAATRVWTNPIGIDYLS